VVRREEGKREQKRVLQPCTARLGTSPQRILGKETGHLRWLNESEEARGGKRR